MNQNPSKFGRFLLAAIFSGTAMVLAGAVGAHDVVLVAIAAGSIGGFAVTLLAPTARARAESRLGGIAAMITFIGGLVEAAALGQFLLWGVGLGLVIGVPIGYLIGRDD